MILPDNETKIDLLNAEPIATTIANVLDEHPGVPITIGIHGDWGAGKSSVLEMLQHAVEKAEDDGVLCLRVNGWSFQGFEDAKIALIEAIVSGLADKRTLTGKAEGALADLYKRINWLKAAKMAGSFALTAATGIPAPDLVNTVVGALRGMAQDPTKLLTADNVKGTLAAAESLLSPAEAKHAPEEIREFRREFDSLLADTGVQQLIVLVDDLDRCLPETAIETLEAIRLFVLTEKTAFVIAADEAMIEYAVRQHFPDLPNTTGPQTYARNYLEKLIQVPFRIPALGVTETRIFVTLLLIGAKVADGDGKFDALIATARERLRRPWQGHTLSEEDIHGAFGGLPNELRDALRLSQQIGPVLAEGTKGNPRQLKRFVNSLLLRLSAADARGFAEDIDVPVLAKLMLAERFQTTFFDQLVRLASTSPTGVVKELAELEQAAKAPAPADAPEKKTVPAATSTGVVEQWLAIDGVKTWAAVQPEIGTKNLQPYLFLTRDRRAFLGGLSVLGHLADIADKLMGSSMGVRALESDLRLLSASELDQLFTAVLDRVNASGNFRDEPAGVAGLRALAKGRPTLQLRLVDFMSSIGVEKLGMWATAGWGGVVEDPAAVTRLAALQDGWGKQTINRGLAAAVSAAAGIGRAAPNGKRV